MHSEHAVGCRQKGVLINPRWVRCWSCDAVYPVPVTWRVFYPMTGDPGGRYALILPE